MYKTGSLLTIGSTTGVKSSSISESTLWGDYTQYVNGGGFALGDGADHACRFEVDVQDKTFFNFGTIFEPVSLRFFTKSATESSMTIDKTSGTVIVGSNVLTPTDPTASLEVHGNTNLIGGLLLNGSSITAQIAALQAAATAAAAAQAEMSSTMSALSAKVEELASAPPPADTSSGTTTTPTNGTTP